MAVSVVLAGAGHTHVELLRRGEAFRRAGYRLTVINPAPTHPYSGMGPGVLGGDYRYEDILLPVADLARRAHAEFLQDRVVGIDAAARTLRLQQSGLLRYDLLSLNLGSEVAGREPSYGASSAGTLFYGAFSAGDRSHGASSPGNRGFGDRGFARPTGTLYPAKPIESLYAARQEIERRVCAERDCRVAVVGGGPASVELAANAAALLTRLGHGQTPRGCAVDLFVAAEPAAYRMHNSPDGGRAVHRPHGAASAGLAGLSGRRERLVAATLQRRGVQLRVGPPVDPDALATDSGYAIVLVATGVRPPAVLRTSGLPLDSSGAVRVDRYLRADGFPNVFAVGDCASFPVAGRVRRTLPGETPGTERTLTRAGVFAVRQQKTLLRNLLVSAERISMRLPTFTSADGGQAEQTPLCPFTGTGDHLSALNLGLRFGIAYRGRWSLAGKLAYRLKDWIDRSFVRRYQHVR